MGDAKSRGRVFYRRCQITGSRILLEMPNHGVAHFTGDAKSQGRAFHRRCQITGSRISWEMAKPHGRAFHGRWPNHRVGEFHGRWPNHMVAHFTGDAKSQGRAFQRRCQITGSHISQEMPNHGVARFTGDAKSHGRAFQRVAPNHRVAYFRGSCQITGSAFHRVAPNHRVGRSQDGAISGISRAASLTHVLHCCFIFLVFLFGFNFFFVNPFFFAICYLLVPK